MIEKSIGKQLKWKKASRKGGLFKVRHPEFLDVCICIFSTSHRQTLNFPHRQVYI